MDEFIFDDSRTVLTEATTRHSAFWPIAAEAIALGHLAYERERETSAGVIPGVPGLRRARNDVNDNCWRVLRWIADPLLESGSIREFANVDGGDFAILPDGLRVRLKRGNHRGETSNFATQSVRRQQRVSTRYALYPGQTQLDLFIADGLCIDVVYVSTESPTAFEQVGLRLGMARVSPFEIIDLPTSDVLKSVSPTAFELASGLRQRFA